MTFDDDFCQFETEFGAPMRFTCKELKVEWPPPEFIELMIFRFKRESFSQITDEQRDGMTHVCRGAVYRVLQ